MSEANGNSLHADARCGLVHCESWAGHSAHKVTILRETKTRYVCRWDDLPAFRHATGDIIRPPKYAVEITPNAARDPRVVLHGLVG